MARNFTITWEGGTGTHRPSSIPAERSVLPTSLVPVDVFDPDTDWEVHLHGVVPQAYTGTGTLKLDFFVAANSTAGQISRWEATTEFMTSGADENADTGNLDSTADSAGVTDSTTAYAEELGTITLTPATTPAAGDRFRIKLRRDANGTSGTDSLTVNALVTAYEFYEETA